MIWSYIPCQNNRRICIFGNSKNAKVGPFQPFWGQNDPTQIWLILQYSDVSRKNKNFFFGHFGSSKNLPGVKMTPSFLRSKKLIFWEKKWKKARKVFWLTSKSSVNSLTFSVNLRIPIHIQKIFYDFNEKKMLRFNSVFLAYFPF